MHTPVVGQACLNSRVASEGDRNYVNLFDEKVCIEMYCHE
jgi:hypothetical protein